MESRTGTDEGKNKPRGRQSKGDNQPAVIEVAKLRDDLPRLKKLKTAKDEADQDYKDAIAKTAEKSGLLASVVGKVVSAYVGENFEEEKRKAEQLSLAFEEVGKA